MFVLLALQWSLLCLWSHSMPLLCSAFVHFLSARHCSASQSAALRGLQGRHSKAVCQYNFIGRLLAGVALQGQCSIQMSPRPIAVSTRGQPVCRLMGCLGRKHFSSDLLLGPDWLAACRARETRQETRTCCYATGSTEAVSACRPMQAWAHGPLRCCWQH